MLRRLIGEDVEIRIALAAEEMRALVDPGQLVQIIMNLAVNARDAMPNGGVLTIETAAAELGPEYAQTHPAVAAGAYVQLAIGDTGAGMDQATLARIFEPFFTTKGPGAGTGLGLSSAYGIVKQSNGHISVYSELGRGTSFHVYLPRVFEPAEAKAARTSTAPAPGTETVLLVEDDPSVWKLMREMLHRAGYEVIEAANGAEALLACERSSAGIALMITDLVMPGINGWELAKRLAPLRPEMKVLYMSGYSNHAALASGVLDRHEFFIQKPFTPGALAEKIRRVLDQR
jgi:CheY-like chemotaxis protein